MGLIAGVVLAAPNTEMPFEFQKVLLLKKKSEHMLQGQPACA